jgi:Holliday junction resolvase RusA-like endonuclease
VEFTTTVLPGDDWRCVELTVPLLAPSKKNLMRPSTGGKTPLAYKAGCKAQMNSLVEILAFQWAVDYALEHQTIIWSLHISPKQDRDGVITTLLDAMVKAHILKDDSVQVNNGPWLVERARELKQPQTPEHKITLLWRVNPIA